nr:reverse transcriptase domain-containing protein [Tanacetum cinerariifolium]
MADRTMEELLQAPTEGYREAIVIPKILAKNFEVKTNLLQDVPNDAIKLMLFPYSLEDRARIWYEKEPPNSILTWDDLVNKFVNQVFPSSKTTHLKNEISRLTQRFEETFSEAWDRFKELLRACPHHGFSELTQIDMFYNGLTEQDQDSLNAAAGGNLLNKTTREALQIIENKSKNQPSTSGTLPSNTIPNPKGEMKVVTTRSGLAYEGPSTPLEKVDEQNTKEILDKEQSNSSGSIAQIQPPVVPNSILEPDVSRTQTKPIIPYPSRLNDQKLREKATNQMEILFQIFHDLHFDISFADALLLMPKFASTIKSLLANKDKLFELAKVPLNENCSAMLLKKLPEKLDDPELTPTRMTLELADRSITRPKGVVENVFVKVGKFHFLTDFVVVEFEADLRVPLILGRSFLRTGRTLIDVYGEEITLRYNPKSSSPTLVSDDLISESDARKVPIVKSSSPTLTSFGERDILFLEKLLNEDPFQLPSMDLKLAEESKEKSSVEEPPELKLKELPSHLEYFLDDSNKLPVIIAKNLSVDEKEALINVLKEGIVLGHKISKKSGIEVDRAKVDVIAKLPHPTTVKVVRSFLGHAGFYRRFIRDFSKIARLITHLLEKETPFVFSKECMDAFNTLKKKLTEAPILVVPDWNLPFELMCDASDYAIGAVLGQRKSKHFQPIHYESKTMTEAQIHYTTTEKEMLAVVYAFEKFRPYLVLSKSIVYTGHSALKYFLNK